MVNLINAFYGIVENVSILHVKFYAYLLFFLIIYYTFAKKFKIQWIILLFTSLFFYLLNGRKAAFLILIPGSITYIASSFVTKIDGIKRKLLTSFIVTFDVVFLICFKELNFFIHIWNHIGSCFNLEILNEVHFKSPFGISYIVLMLISYFLDVNWNIIEHQKNPLKFLTYILFFPITSSGPICRYTNLQESLFSIHDFEYEKFCLACQRILCGFFKKLVIADRLAVMVSNVYVNSEATGFVVLIGLLSFSLQMYFDFSGCMDIVIGIGALFGIELPENFKQPFYSTSLSEFWRRWHITLGLWVKDYVLYPVLKSSLVQKISIFLKSKFGKKNRYAKLIPTWIGLFVTWFVIGFWHGGSWNYIFGSGLFFFLMIAGGQLLEPVFTRMISFFHIKTESCLWKIFQRIRTALLFAASASFQRSNGMKFGLNMWKRVFSNFFSWNHSGMLVGVGWKFFIIIIIFIILEIFVIEKREYKELDNYVWLKTIATKNIIIRWICYYALVYSVVLLGFGSSGFNPSNFIYMGF